MLERLGCRTDTVASPAAIVDAAGGELRYRIRTSDGEPGWFVDKLGDFLLSQSEKKLTAEQQSGLKQLAENFSTEGAQAPAEIDVLDAK